MVSLQNPKTRPNSLKTKTTLLHPYTTRRCSQNGKNCPISPNDHETLPYTSAHNARQLHNLPFAAVNQRIRAIEDSNSSSIKEDFPSPPKYDL